MDKKIRIVRTKKEIEKDEFASLRWSLLLPNVRKIEEQEAVIAKFSRHSLSTEKKQEPLPTSEATNLFKWIQFSNNPAGSTAPTLKELERKKLSLLRESVLLTCTEDRIEEIVVEVDHIDKVLGNFVSLRP
ncbi:MAG: hypothetical protein PHX30_00795 [Candidatus Pacebacteria bacterium]|jgi:hypothetical protein|nr:hypothetical protein [Candidatus Paceibacterota bacterium]